MKRNEAKKNLNAFAVQGAYAAILLRLLMLLSGCLIFPLIGNCQNQNWTIEVKGLVEEGDKKLPGAVISLYANNSLVTSQTSPNGGFDFNLNGNMNYVLTFTKPGYITKRLSFSTMNVPAERAKAGFSPYSAIEVDIFPEIPGTDIDQILQQPIGKIGYDPSFKKVGDFTYDEKYTESIQSELDKILAAAEKAKQLAAQYKKIIAKADGEFNGKDYANAKTDYSSASALKPSEQYPKDQIAAIDKLLAAQAAAQADAAAKARIQAKYDSLVKIGDNDFKAKSYAGAKAAYNGALGVKPAEQYPKDQLAAIDKAMKADADAAAKARMQAKYDSLVKIGDNDFKAKSYAGAKAAYKGALGVKPDEQYPKDQLAAIDNAMKADADAAAKARMQAKYDSLVKIGDNDFKAKSYAGAKTAYKGALGVKPDEQYPKDQLAAIDNAMKADADAAAKARMQAKYDSLVKIGDNAFKTKKYSDAKTAYNGALGVKPDEQYPKDQIAAIDKLLAAQAAAAADAAAKARMQAKYDSLVKIGDNAFKTKKYSDAKSAYNGALDVKPGEQYPKDQIAAIDKLLAAQAAAAADAAAKARTQAKYDSLVKIGDNAFKTKKYSDAKSAYNGALDVKPGEQYPKDQLAAIDNAMKADADAAMNARIQAKYDSLVKIGDNAFKTKKYTNAKSAYNVALGVKADEQYPKDQIAAIDKLLESQANAAADAARKARIQAKYDSLIRIGDAEFKVKSYEAAKKAYNGALKLKPEEQYPKDQLAAIERAIKADENAKLNALKYKALQRKYDSIIKLADAAMQGKTYPAAIDLYNKASQVLPAEQYPKDQIAAIRKILSPPVNTSDTANSGPDSVAAKYAQGVTEEQVDEPNGCVITKRVLVIGKHGWIYTRKSWSFGVYFFKASPPDYEDEAITEDQWTKETHSGK